MSEPYREEWKDGVRAADTPNKFLALTNDTAAYSFESGGFQIDIQRNDNESFSVETDREMLEAFVDQLKQLLENSAQTSQTDDEGGNQ